MVADSRQNYRVSDIDRNALNALLQLGLELKENVSLARYTSMGTGGPADLFTTVKLKSQLQTLVLWAREVKLPYFILGGGSNILVSDRGMRGLVILNRCRRVELNPHRTVEDDGTISTEMIADSGGAMAGAARQTVAQGLSGLEWAVSLPGTVGGAVVGNSGAHGGESKDTLIDARVVTSSGEVETMRVEDFGYAYRSSRLKRRRPLQAGFHPVILDARFRLTFDDSVDVRELSAQYLSHRRSTQPVEPSIGSTFKNPPDEQAGRLIEQAGLKGLRVGDVEISQVHANFIINPGGFGHAKSEDVLKLVNRVQEEVRRRTGIELEPEIQLAGEWE